jgi:hypothetical protein
VGVEERPPVEVVEGGLDVLLLPKTDGFEPKAEVFDGTPPKGDGPLGLVSPPPKADIEPVFPNPKAEGEPVPNAEDVVVGAPKADLFGCPKALGVLLLLLLLLPKAEGVEPNADG